MPTIKDDPKEYDNLLASEKAALQAWIQLTCRHGKSHEPYSKETSYGMKHAFEEVGFYVSNGEFKGAMQAANYFEKKSGDLNWVWHVRPRCRHPHSLCPYFGHSMSAFTFCHVTHKQHLEFAELVKTAVREDELRRSLARKGA